MSKAPIPPPKPPVPDKTHTIKTGTKREPPAPKT